jgi:hypothetical protein
VWLFEQETCPSLCLLGRRPLVGSCHILNHILKGQVPRLTAGPIAAEEGSSHPRRAPSGGWASRNCSRKLPFLSRKTRFCSRRPMCCVRWSEAGHIALPLFVGSTRLQASEYLSCRRGWKAQAVTLSLACAVALLTASKLT